MLLPVAALGAMAVRLAYDDWTERRALREEAARAEARRQAAGHRRLVALDGGGGRPSDEGAARQDGLAPRAGSVGRLAGVAQWQSPSLPSW